MSLLPPNIPRLPEEKLRAMIDAMPIMVAYLDTQLHFRYCNRAYEEWFERSAADIYGKHMAEVDGPAAYAAVSSYGEQALAGNFVTFERFGRYKSSDRRWMRINLIPDKSEDGTVHGFFALFQDLSESKEAQASLRQREEYLAGLMEMLADGVLSVKMPERLIEYVNQATVEIFGYQADELVGQTTRMIYLDDAHYEDFGNFLENALAHGQTKVRREMELQRKDGSLFWADVSTNLMNATKEPWIVISLIRDITERKQIELEKERINHQLGERIKELTTLHTAGRILAFDDASIPDILHQIVSILPAGWQYPEITAARIIFGDAEYITPNFARSPWKQSAAFRTFDGKIGMLEVAYLEACPAEAEGPFLAEERSLINTLAEMLQIFLERRHAREQVQRQLDQLTSLHTIDMTITSSLDLHHTLNIILEQVTARLSVDAASILLINGQTQMLEFAVGLGFHTTAIQKTRLKLGQSYAGRSALKRQTIHADNLAQASGDLGKMLQNEQLIDYYCSPLIAKGQVKGVIEVFHRMPINPNRDWLAFLESLATQTAIAIDNIELFNGLQSSNLQLTLAYETTLEGWVYALDLRDRETEGHTQRVTRKTMQLARVMGLTEEKLVHVQRGALLHDIGKMGIPDSILLKPGPLTEDEWVVMRRHPVYAYEWLYPIPYLRPALDIPYCHHEKWDGTGYPRGLKGDDIPLTARIFSVVDVWDALRFDRPYRAAWSDEKVRDYIRSLSGIHFDPQVVAVFLGGVVDDEK